MDSVIASVFLPAALAVVMLGLGLSLTVDDFARATRRSRAVVVALTLQLLVLPALCFGLVVAFGLPPVLAVGMMLLAASPGGTVANLFSHLFHGDVALNITLTAINSVIAVVTVPLVTNFALEYFAPDLGTGQLTLQFGKMLQVFVIVLIPVGIGMILRRSRPAFAERMDRPVRIASTLVLALAVLGTAYNERAHVLGYVTSVGVVALLFCLASLTLGFVVPRAMGVEHRQAVAAAFEIGAHNAALAITIAVSALNSVPLAVPAAVYGLVMIPCTAAVGRLLTRGSPRPAAVTSAPAADTPR
ncbi:MULTISPECIES: bile acid:sodium symporter family protein [Streptomyces]|uniref:Bile acid:sodium symporter family protein n=1 Tax=Streptomyces mirabilis TaxID=68239 RepID=A0ABU3UH11_9ACTN|nr:MULTISPECIES: bile acid:sodium symporter family protein [Streptomyces]MCX5353214.1 bile acid:sodium symporter family protein [Streptomyces mirabilis]MDU8993211.1 bile acid:sodium symporter family protein [Streptomyces mirabilis]QDN81395.1 bile acid:sodium symporter family protein [Streptomyces sp. S1A1-7]QDN91233.1 bile acid:sodium symporter family protein [Streptomyces sp. RLB3-6]QDO12057.1 bile acid:sodium symporter family protein [Streptomyces sp. S1D4-23]